MDSFSDKVQSLAVAKHVADQRFIIINNYLFIILTAS